MADRVGYTCGDDGAASVASTRRLRLLAQSVVYLPPLTACTTAGRADHPQQELTVEDFSFQGPLGSAGTTLRRVGRNHFVATLGAAPNHPEWCNKIQFTIARHALGNALKLDVEFPSPAMSLNEYFASFSYDGSNWWPVTWEHGNGGDRTRDTLIFPPFEQDRVFVGHQVPMSYEDSIRLIDAWCEAHPSLTSTEVLGQSIGGRDIVRLEVTDSTSSVPRERRWVHYISNQHPGEHNAQWRMSGMVEWLLGDSPEAANCRAHSIFEFVFFSSPDAPSNGWYRVAAEGVDMNRSYIISGAGGTVASGDEHLGGGMQCHEAAIVQRDVERMMSSETPVTSLWSMHTWTGIVEPLLIPGPEMVATRLGDWTVLAEIMARHDSESILMDTDGLATQESQGGRLVKPLKTQAAKNSVMWTDGPHIQFGISCVLCEGGSHAKTKELNQEGGRVIVRSLAEYYSGERR